MKVSPNSIVLFRHALHVWLIGFILTSLPAMEELWSDPISPALPAPGFARSFTHAFNSWAEGWEVVGVAILLFLATFQLLRRSDLVLSVMIWALFTSLMNKAWLASSGGQQLISNMLFWLIFLPEPRKGEHPSVIGTAAFWIVRLQLLIAYVATAMHKMTGDLWISGDAIAVVVSDPLYGPQWLLRWPVVMMLLTWSTLLFQITFPIAIWFQRTRIPWMIAGILFHVVTAIIFQIPEMAFAFILCYPIWMNDREVRKLLMIPGRMRMITTSR